MKPERVQPPSIFSPTPIGDQALAWTINTEGFDIACRVARVLCELLENISLPKSINIKDSGVELWINQKSNTGEESLQLDQLLHETHWSHPVQVLEKPRADFTALLRACRLRMVAAEGETRRSLEAVQEKLERAVRIAETARRRREMMQRSALA